MLQEYHGDITLVPRVGPKDFLKLLNNPNAENVRLWARRGMIMTYFKLEQIRASMYFEKLLKSILHKLDPRKQSYKELLERSVYTDMHRSSRCIDNRSDRKRRPRRRGYIRKNFSVENFVETGGLSQNRSVFDELNHKLGVGKFINEHDERVWGGLESHSRSSLDTRSDNADFYRVIVNKTSACFRLAREREKLV